MTLGLAASFNRCFDRVEKHAAEVDYPYLILLGEKDQIVDN